MSEQDTDSELRLLAAGGSPSTTAEQARAASPSDAGISSRRAPPSPARHATSGAGGVEDSGGRGRHNSYQGGMGKR